MPGIIHSRLPISSRAYQFFLCTISVQASLILILATFMSICRCYYRRMKFVHALLLALLAGSLAGCFSEPPAERLDAITVEVTGDEFNWYFRYPGADGQLGTDDDRSSVRNLYLPDNTDVTLKLKSKDYVYNLTLPDIDKKEIAVPELDFTMAFTTGEQGTWELKGDQFCGFSHETLIGKVFIRDQSAGNYYSW